MFSGKKAIEEFKSEGHCFVVLKLSDDIKAEYHRNVYNEKTRRSFAKLFMENPFDHVFLDRLMRTPEKYFTFVETLDAKIDNKGPSKDICGGDPFMFVFNRFESRLSVELNISQNQLIALLDGLYSEYQGQQCFNPAMAKTVEHRLHVAFVETHVDIKNVKENEWVRVDILKPKPEPKAEKDDGCRIA